MHNSAPGKGSLFRIEVPVERVEAPEAVTKQRDREPVIGLEPSQPEYRILMIEDQRQNWLLLQGLLLDAGFQVQVAEDGAQGVEKFRTWKPHLIWMAYAFPSWEGWKQHAKSGFWTAAVMPRLWRWLRRRSPISEKTLWPRAWMILCEHHIGGRKSSTAWPVTSAYAIYTRRPGWGARPIRSPHCGEPLAKLPQQLRKELADALVRLDRGGNRPRVET